MSESSGRVGSVCALWRFPVKSMQGERVESAEVVAGGIVGDRAYALVEEETGKVVSAKHPKKWPRVLECQARFVEEPTAEAPPPPVEIELPNGAAVRSDDPDADTTLSAFFGHAVRLQAGAQNGYTIDQYHPDLDYDPDHRDALVEIGLGSAFFDERGLPSVVPQGSFLDLFPVSVIATATLEQAAELSPGSNFDVRRFRMNVVVETDEAGFVDNEWIGHQLAVGDGVQLAVAMPDPRCVMPSLAQPGLERDGQVLKTLAQHNRLDVAGKRYPCAGVYAVATGTGTATVGDPVALI